MDFLSSFGLDSLTFDRATTVFVRYKNLLTKLKH